MPVIVLTARDSVTDTVSALEGGADDYMPKPFRFAELIARIRLRLRQARRPPRGPDDAGRRRRAARPPPRRSPVGGGEVELSAREFALAEIFLLNPGQVLSREQLLDQVWGYDFDPGSNVVDVYVGYLRRKFGADAISTVRGMGYRFSPYPEPVDLEPASEPRWRRASTGSRASAISAAAAARRGRARGGVQTIATSSGTCSGIARPLEAAGSAPRRRPRPFAVLERPVARDGLEQRRAQAPDVTGSAGTGSPGVGTARVTCRGPCRSRP